MAAARRRFERRGFRATSIAAIARAAGVAVGTIYLYFKNKEQILVALFDESSARWMLERATNRTPSQYLAEKIWQPLGMEYSATWSIDSARDGLELMHVALNARAIDFA